MTTVRDIINDALLHLGVLDQADALEYDKAAAALRELNRMIQSWNTESLIIYSLDRHLFNFVPGQQSYTIGASGTPDFVTTVPIRPMQIDMASVLVASDTVEIPIQILNDEEWRDIVVKSVQGSYPLQMWSNGNYPLNTLYFWPIPNEAYKLVLYLWGQLTAFSTINDTVTLPQGYEDALVTNLAIRLSPSYAMQPSPVLMQMAQVAKARIKKMNWEPSYRSVDKALAGHQTNIGQRSRGYVVD